MKEKVFQAATLPNTGEKKKDCLLLKYLLLLPAA